MTPTDFRKARKALEEAKDLLERHWFVVKPPNWPALERRIVAELRVELANCPATRTGYAEAAYLRERIALWEHRQQEQSND